MNTSSKLPVSVGILTRNSGATLRRALESVKECSDIIVCDGGSTDDTLQIAAQFGARILSQNKTFLDEHGRLFDYGGARNQTLDAARENWFFALDSDEYAGPDLIEAMRQVVTTRAEGAFWVNRKYTRHGVVIDYATTYPNRQMRFFSKRSVTRFIKKMHERIELKEGAVPEMLGGCMYVPFDMSAEDVRTKWTYQIAVEVARLGSLSPWRFLEAVFDFSKVSLLYLLRYLRIIALNRQPRLPFSLEMERHILHLRTLLAFAHIVHLRQPRQN